MTTRQKAITISALVISMLLGLFAGIIGIVKLSSGDFASILALLTGAAISWEIFKWSVLRKIRTKLTSTRRSKKKKEKTQASLKAGKK